MLQKVTVSIIKIFQKLFGEDPVEPYLMLGS